MHTQPNRAQRPTYVDAAAALAQCTQITVHQNTHYIPIDQQQPQQRWQTNKKKHDPSGASVAAAAQITVLARLTHRIVCAFVRERTQCLKPNFALKQHRRECKNLVR